MPILFMSYIVRGCCVQSIKVMADIMVKRLVCHTTLMLTLYRGNVSNVVSSVYYCMNKSDSSVVQKLY